MKRQLSLGCPRFSPPNKDICIKKNEKKILAKNRICLGQTTQDTIFVRIEDWGLRICFEIENRYMQCCRKRNYKNFLLHNHGAKPNHQDATPQTGRSRFGPTRRHAPRFSTTGLGYSILVRGNFGLVMLWDRFIFVLSTTLHQRNFEIVTSILVGSEQSVKIGGRGSLRIVTDRFGV